jgi:hypothetical protein
VVTLNDAHDGGQAQSPPGELGRKEGIEHASQGVGRHARTTIGHLEVDIRSLGFFRRLAPVHQGAETCVLDLLGLHHSGAEGDGALAVMQRVRRVGDQVHHDLPNLGGIGIYRRQL